MIEIIKELENQEDIKVQSFDIYKEILLTSIMVDNDKFDKDIKIPILTPRIKRNEPDFDKLAVDEMPSLRLEFKNIQISANNPFEYIARDMFTDEIVLRRKWDMPVIQEAKSVAGYYANLICKELHLVNSFAKMLPIVKGYISNKLFNRKVDFDDPKMQGQLLYNLIEPVVQKGLIDIFVESFKNMTYKENEPEFIKYMQLSDVQPFISSKTLFTSKKCIFNKVPCDNEYEIAFAKFLDRADDVDAFCKIVPSIGFYLEYRDSEKNQRYYYPDFIVRTKGNEHIIIETKGLVDENVKFKDERAKRWCKDASENTKTKWTYLRVNEDDFENYRLKSMKGLLSLLGD